MVGRVLRRATALGLAAAAAGSLHAVSTWKPPEPLSPFTPSVRRVLLESAQGLQAALLRAHPLSGAHLRDVRARAEQDLARADAEGGEGDPAAAIDLRLLLALLAARDGRADEALQLYAEAARDSPFDPRPRVLAYYVCFLAERVDEAAQWKAAYHRLVLEIINPDFPGYESYEITKLIRELVVAATLGGVFNLSSPEGRGFVMYRAGGEVDSWLVAALQDKTLSTTERLQLRALRVYLHSKVQVLLREEAKIIMNRDAYEDEDGGAEAARAS